MTNLVLQAEKTGCSCACVAMLACKTYREVKSDGLLATDEVLFKATKYVRKLLADLDVVIDGSEAPLPASNRLSNQTLLATMYSIEEEFPSWH